MLSKDEIASMDAYLEWAIAEDLGDGDHTSLACIPPEAIGQAKLIAKEEGVIAGLPLADYLFKKFNAADSISFFKKEGDRVSIGDKILTVSGSVGAILTAERTILNFLQRLSGIATKTAQYVEIAKPYGVRVADTRKTTPGMRLLEKSAVVAGGGSNHRMGLYDLIMIKDNHIDFAGGISKAVGRTTSYLESNRKKLRIEVETRSLEEVEEALQTGKVDIIMLDNFSPEKCKSAVKLVNKSCELEASGNITLENLKSYAATGVDYISSGALTHSVKSLDLSLKADFQPS